MGKNRKTHTHKKNERNKWRKKETKINPPKTKQKNPKNNNNNNKQTTTKNKQTNKQTKNKGNTRIYIHIQLTNPIWTRLSHATQLCSLFGPEGITANWFTVTGPEITANWFPVTGPETTTNWFTVTGSEGITANWFTVTGPEITANYTTQKNSRATSLVIHHSKQLRQITENIDQNFNLFTCCSIC